MNISGFGNVIPVPPQLSGTPAGDPIIGTNTPSVITPGLTTPSFNSPITAGSGADAPSFRDIIGAAINQVDSAQNTAATKVEQFLAGEGDDLHATILAGQRADLEFQMFMQVRNKVVAAYQEVMKMQL